MIPYKLTAHEQQRLDRIELNLNLLFSSRGLDTRPSKLVSINDFDFVELLFFYTKGDYEMYSYHREQGPNTNYFACAVNVGWCYWVFRIKSIREHTLS